MALQDKLSMKSSVSINRTMTGDNKTEGGTQLKVKEKLFKKVLNLGVKITSFHVLGKDTIIAGYSDGQVF
jgi:hypothetical protein